MHSLFDSVYCRLLQCQNVHNLQPTTKHMIAVRSSCRALSSKLLASEVLLGQTAMKRTINSSSSDTTNGKKHHWSMGLLHTMNDPDSKVKEDNTIVVIKDKYPKAQFHYLVLPKANIPSIWDIKKEHKDLLLHMEKVAEELVKEHKDHEFIIGYHALPTMHRLHLHVVSTDFNSPCLKSKQHWNSFTTQFFLPSKDICKQLCENGKLEKVSREVYKKYLYVDLKCHKCSVTPKNMPELKRHLLTHLHDKKNAST